MRWHWVVVPSLIVLGAVTLAQALSPGGYFYGGAAALALSGAYRVLAYRRRRGEPPARPGWEFHPWPGLAPARAGQAFAFTTLIILIVLFGTATPDPFMIGATAVVALIPLGVGVRLVTRLVRRTPALRLSATGIEVHGKRYAWERIGGVELNGEPANPRLDVLIAGRRRPVTLRPADVDANLLFLMDLLGYCQSHPEHRAAIGQAEEAQRVHGLLLSARLAAGLRGGPRPIVVGPQRLAAG
ncbi:hypothetical protein [Dactylosporangium sp. NPDC048998]|uniref:hypothetical protein n=1 Tax=Dactylosporangium sp. NPDC048998 TaxID=3363976 RepID=UPI003715D1FB